MAKSMTGFGRGFYEDENTSVEIEFKSVNSRFLDCNIRMPKSLIVLEDRIRKKLQEKILRGKIDLFLTYKDKTRSGVKITVNKELAEKYISQLRLLAEEEGLIDDLSLSTMLRLDDVVEKDEVGEDPENVWKCIEKALEGAMEEHDLMRSTEGENLKKDLLVKRDNIREYLEEIKRITPGIVPKFREKLEERIKELTSLNVDEERMATEICLFSDRASIDEEITRLSSHLDQLGDILNEEEPIGRKLDFLLQEINREANTMASKSPDLELTSNVLKIKNEMEKIREQIQNLE